MAKKILITSVDMLRENFSAFVLGNAKGVIELPCLMVNPMLFKEGIRSLSALSGYDEHEVEGIANGSIYIKKSDVPGCVCTTTPQENVPDFSSDGEYCYRTGAEGLVLLIELCDVNAVKAKARAIEKDCMENLEELRSPEAIEKVVAHGEKLVFYADLLDNARKTLDAVFMYERLHQKFFIKEVSLFPLDVRGVLEKSFGVNPYEADKDIANRYISILMRADRIRKLDDAGAPDVIMRNEKRMLQEKLNALVFGTENEPSCLMSMLAKGVSMV